jgi:hypothetical protein
VTDNAQAMQLALRGGCELCDLADVSDDAGKHPISSTTSWPGKSAKRVFAQMSRPSTSCLVCCSQDVDARHKAGHDKLGAWTYERS